MIIKIVNWIVAIIFILSACCVDNLSYLPIKICWGCIAYFTIYKMMGGQGHNEK
jgi:hypothetical protein